MQWIGAVPQQLSREVFSSPLPERDSTSRTWQASPSSWAGLVKGLDARSLRRHAGKRSLSGLSFLLPRLPTEALTLAKTLFSRVVKHGVSQQPIRFGLVTAAIGFEPCDYVGIQTHRDGLLRWPIELADFGAVPVENRPGIREINVLVSFCGDGLDVPLLFLCELPHRLSFHGTQPREPR